MAGDWLKMRVDLLTSPKVVRMASALNADRFRIIGGLLYAWSLFDAHSTDGRLSGYSPSAVDEIIGWNGFSDALILVGWMVVDGDSVYLPEFDTHNGAPAKRRAQEADRKRRERSTAVKEFAGAVDDLGVVIGVLESSANESTKSVTRVEESRGEKKNKLPAVIDSSPVQVWLMTNKYNTEGERKGITDNQIKAWSESYPAVSVVAELMKIRAWLESNSSNRKTLSGMDRFVNSWLAREQNKGGVINRNPPPASGLTRDQSVVQQLTDKDWAK